MKAKKFNGFMQVNKAGKKVKIVTAPKGYKVSKVGKHTGYAYVAVVKKGTKKKRRSSSSDYSFF
jgi:hypothetical protein